MEPRRSRLPSRLVLTQSIRSSALVQAPMWIRGREPPRGAQWPPAELHEKSRLPSVQPREGTRGVRFGSRPKRLALFDVDRRGGQSCGLSKSTRLGHSYRVPIASGRHSWWDTRCRPTGGHHTQPSKIRHEARLGSFSRTPTRVAGRGSRSHSGFRQRFQDWGCWRAGYCWHRGLGPSVVR